MDYKPALYDNERRPSLASSDVYTMSLRSKSYSNPNWRDVTPSGLSSELLKTNLLKRIIAACLLLVAFLHLISRNGGETDVTGKKARSEYEAYFLHHWANHVSEHPVRARDRAGFAEMGLRTQMYAHLLADPTLPSFDYFEKVLWPYIPGIKHLRQSFLNGTKFASTSNKGIVMSLGGKQFEFGVQFISIVRNVHHCEYPIELYYYGEDDLPLAKRDYLTSTFSNVRTIDLSQLTLFDKSLTRLEHQGFALKPFALIATNFTQVILADADAVFLSRPQDFFQVEGFKKTGTLFFHDRDHLRSGPDTIIHDFMADQLQQRPPSDRLAQSHFWTKKGIYEQESGIVVVDKSRIDVFAALLFTAWQNTGEIRDQTTYRVFWGDKESFWLAFELAQIPYYFVEHYAGAIGSEHATQGDGFCSEHPLHFFDNEKDSDALGKPAWFNGGLLDVKKLSREKFLNADAWAMKGEWEFMFDTEVWCIRNYTRGSMSQYGLDKKMHSLIETGKRAAIDARTHLSKLPSS